VTIEGEDKGVISVFRDITNERKIDKAKSELISLVGHQLRAPLSSTKWYTEMLLSGDGGELTEEQGEYVQAVFDGNERLIQIVASLLNISRLELGTFQLDAQQTDVICVSHEIIDEEIEASEKDLNHTIIKEFDDTI